MTHPSRTGNPRFWQYMTKPDDDASTSSFQDPLDLTGTVGQVVALATFRRFWFEPTQILFSLLPDALNTSLRVLGVDVAGIDQFGFPARERVTLSTDGSTTPNSRQGTRRCYVHIESAVVAVAQNIFVGMSSADQVEIGVGRSGGDMGSDRRPDDSFRLALPARVRDAAEVQCVHDVFAGAFYSTEGSPTNIRVDVPHQSVEIDLPGAGGALEAHFAVILEPNTTALSWGTTE